MRVVLAEDNALQRRVLAMLLRTQGVVVNDVADGVEALAAIEQQPPAVVITDGQMPRLDGIGLTRALRQRGDSTPVIMVSGQAADEFVAQARDAGINHYLHKPVDLEALLAVMARVAGPVGAAA